jgi:hypothetical protein
MIMKKKQIPEERQVPLMLAFLCIATEPGANINRKVQILDKFGLSDDELASICDCNNQSVRNARQKNKNKKR